MVLGEEIATAERAQCAKLRNSSQIGGATARIAMRGCGKEEKLYSEKITSATE